MDIKIGSIYHDSTIELPKFKKAGKDIVLRVFGFSNPQVKELPALNELGGMIYIK